MNKNFAVVVVGAALALSMNAFATDAPAAAGAKTAKPAAAKKTAMLMPAADVKWNPLMPDMANGPQIAFVNGDMKSKGPVSFFLKLAPDFNSGMHTHNSDYQAAVVTGTVTDELEGQDPATAKQMGPGSAWWQPAKEKHSNHCVSTEPCLIYVASAGPFSFTPAKAAGEKKDMGAKPMSSPAAPK